MVVVVVLATLVLSKPDIRSSLSRTLRLAVARKLATVWIVYAGWIIAFVLITDWLGVWRAVLAKDTLVWGLTAGLASLVGFTEATEPGFFRRAFYNVLGVVGLVEYFVSLASFSFVIEFLLQPFVFFFAVAPVVVDEPGQKKTWHRASNWFFAVLGVALLGYTAHTLFESRQTLDMGHLALQAVWPVLLGIWVLVLVFALAMVSIYEQAFRKLRWIRDGNNGLWKAKLGLVLALGVRVRWINEASKGGTYHVAHADSVVAAYEAAKRFKKERLAEKRQEGAYQDDLVRYAGSAERDQDGRPRDKREFRETRHALQWLHTCQMGWYPREPTGYKPDLIERFEDDFTKYGLPIPSGISLRVSDDGERWYAWRRTPGGHHFAIGASEGPPSEWLYDGPEPPQDFPGVGPEWGESPYSVDRCPNWQL